MGDLRAAQVFFHPLLEFLQQLLALDEVELDFGHKGLVFVRVEVFEGEVLQLRLYVKNTEALGQRGVERNGLVAYLQLLFLREEVERAHIVEAVGQLDDDDADILGRGQDHFAPVLRLRLVARGELQGLYLGHAQDQLVDLRTELLPEGVAGHRGVLQHVVHEARGYGLQVHLEIHQDLGDSRAMDEVDLSRSALLVRVRVQGKLPGVLQLGGVLGGIFPEFFQQVFQLHGFSSGLRTALYTRRPWPGAGRACRFPPARPS